MEKVRNKNIQKAKKGELQGCRETERIMGVQTIWFYGLQALNPKMFLKIDITWITALKYGELITIVKICAISLPMLQEKV